MKKLLLGLIIFLSIITLYLYYVPNNKKIVYKNTINNSQVINNSVLTMMYETEENSGEYQVSSDSSWPQEGYIFNEKLSDCENNSNLTWDSKTNKVIMQANTSDKCYVYFDKESDKEHLAEYIKGLYSSDGENGLYYHDGQGTYGALESADYSYRYSGANPNNYVCFGSDDTTCPNDNLYRIIGVFGNQVKLIKYEYANSDLLGTNGEYSNRAYSNTSSTYYKGTKTTIDRYYWNNSTRTNTWSESELNTINLNQNFLDNIGSKWNNLIATTNWKVGGNIIDNIYNVPVKQTYQNEIVNPALNTTYDAKIGLMYVSDYGYAASPANWNTNLYNYDTNTNRNNNWMFMGQMEWTITRRSDSDSGVLYVFNLRDRGSITTGCVNVILEDVAARPTFYLNSDVAYISGTGTLSDPYIIE